MIDARGNPEWQRIRFKTELRLSCFLSANNDILRLVQRVQEEISHTGQFCTLAQQSIKWVFAAKARGCVVDDGKDILSSLQLVTRLGT